MMPNAFESRKRFLISTVLLLLQFVIIDGTSLADEQILFSFDDRKLSVDWSAVGKIKARRESAPADDQDGKLTPTENGVIVETEGEAGLFAKSGVVPGDWDQFDRISFWVYRSAEETKAHPESVIEVQVYEPKGKARFWRKVQLNHTGWKEISVPLRWFRWGTGSRPRWDRVDRFGFWFRDAATVSIDTIWVNGEDKDHAAYFSHQILRQAAFPNSGDASRIVTSKDAALLTNAPALDTTKLIAHLDKVATAVREDFPFLEEPVRLPLLLVFETRKQYEDFTPRFATKFNSNALKPRSTGFSFHGIATGFWDKEFGTLRPTYTHEFVHSYLAQTARIPNSTEWVHEGVASMYQVRFHPQDNIREIVRDGIEKENFRAPLSELCNGKRIPSNRYWQAMTVVEMLRKTPAYKQKLSALFKAFQDSKSTNLEPHLEPVLDTTWDKFTADWEKFCRNQYISN